MSHHYLDDMGIDYHSKEYIENRRKEMSEDTEMEHIMIGSEIAAEAEEMSLKIKEVKVFNMRFYNNTDCGLESIAMKADEQLIGELNWTTGELVFTGKAQESAKVFFDFLKPYVDEYIKHKGKTE